MLYFFQCWYNVHVFLPPVLFYAKEKLLCRIVSVKEVYKNNKDALVIGADTVVICDNEILGKPKDKQDAKRMITMLSNKTHIVVTGVYLICKDYKKSFKSITEVTFTNMTEEEINDYCELTTIYDKAGAYAIQEDAGKYITNIKGSYNNVVGLPTEELKEYLK